MGTETSQETLFTVRYGGGVLTLNPAHIVAVFANRGGNLVTVHAVSGATFDFRGDDAREFLQSWNRLTGIGDLPK